MATKATSPRTPASSERPEAASPSNMTREQEKKELQHLNDRLTVYTDKVRSLKEQNSELTVEITSIRTQTQEEVASVRSKFELELADARRLADDIAKEKAREQIENRKNAGLADEYKKKLDKEVAAHKKTEDALKAAQRKLSDKEGQLVIVNQKARNLESVVQELRKECQELKDALESAKYALEQETLTRVDLENKLQSKDEGFNFEKEMYDKEIRELRSQLQGLENQLVIRIKSTESQYEGILQEKIQELRELYDSEAEQYKDKYDKLQGMYSKGVEELLSIKEEKRTLSMTVENLKSELSQLQSKNASLVLRIEDLEKLRAGDQTRADDAIASRDVEIIELRERNDHLMRVKTALDLEISTYRKILEVEEERLNITPPASPVFGSSPQSSRRSVKRVRTEEETVPLLNITPPASLVFGSSPQSSRRSVKRVRTEEETVGTKYSNQGYIQIKEANADGKYIKLFNSGSKDCALGGWSVERSVDGEPAVVYKFTPKYVLKSGTYVTIWAAQGGGQHKPPTDLLFKKIANWGVGKETRTVLIDPDGQEAASALTKEVSVTRSDETDSRPERQGRRDGEVAKGCVIQ